MFLLQATKFPADSPRRVGLSQAAFLSEHPVSYQRCVPPYESNSNGILEPDKRLGRSHARTAGLSYGAFYGGFGLCYRLLE